MLSVSFIFILFVYIKDQWWYHVWLVYWEDYDQMTTLYTTYIQFSFIMSFLVFMKWNHFFFFAIPPETMWSKVLLFLFTTTNFILCYPFHLCIQFFFVSNSLLFLIG